MLMISPSMVLPLAMSWGLVLFIIGSVHLWNFLPLLNLARCMVDCGILAGCSSAGGHLGFAFLLLSLACGVCNLNLGSGFVKVYHKTPDSRTKCCGTYPLF